MSTSKRERKIAHGIVRNDNIIILFSIFIISFTILTLELSLTRLFSAMFTYHYVFLIIIIVFSGLSVGGIISHIYYSELSKKYLFSNLTTIYIFFPLFNLLSLWIIMHLKSHNMIITSILFFIAFIPSGVYIATIYKYNNRHNNMVYLTDIVGASFSALLIMPLLNKYNPMTIILYMSILLLFISVLLASKYSNILLILLVNY
jgi:hypothetical protein